MNQEEANRKKCEKIKTYLEKVSDFDNIGVEFGTRKLSDVRKLYCYLCKTYTNSTLTTIAEALRPGFDHSTVIYNVKKFHEFNESKILYCQSLVEDAESNFNYMLDYIIKKANKESKYVDRWDIQNNLPSGSKIKLSKQFDCSKTYITLVLSGERTDNKGIIKAAELLAAVNIWKTRFCKLGESQL